MHVLLSPQREEADKAERKHLAQCITLFGHMTSILNKGHQNDA